jgi:hypothetical protein
MQSKVVLSDVELPVHSLKPGTNARQCATRGVEILEQSIKMNEWVDQNIIYVTVDPACEQRFRDALSHFRIKQCLAGMPSGTNVQHDNIKAVWLVDECVYILIDGHHRVQALLNLHEARVEGLPEKVRLVQTAHCVFHFPLFIIDRTAVVYFFMKQVPSSLESFSCG